MERLALAVLHSQHPALLHREQQHEHIRQVLPALLKVAEESQTAQMAVIVYGALPMAAELGT